MSANGSQVSIRNLSKTFVGAKVLDAVDVDINVGEVHALAGGNGSGKSTLIKILTGVYDADPGGTVSFGEQTLDAQSLTPAVAHQAGLRVVHQDLGVFPDLSIAENLSLGHEFESGFGGRIRWRQVRARTKALIERFEIPGRPNTLLRQLSRAAQTQVAIARALQDLDVGSEGLLILDEPTASLPVHEVDLLLGHVRRYASQGERILYVSHRLDEVLDLANEVTVLRDGRKVGTFAASELTESKLVDLIAGRHVADLWGEKRTRSRTADQTALEVEDLWAGPLRGVSFQLSKGEILGVAGLLGSGRSELLRTIFGDMRKSSGTVRLGGSPVEFRHPGAAISAGVAFVPENRAEDAAFLDLPVYANAAMLSLPSYWRSARMKERKMISDGVELMEDFKVKGPSAVAPINTLSGGNQQKVVIARWLRHTPQLLLLDEPTQGVDAEARTDIYTSIQRAVEGDAAAIIVVSDLEELSRVADRIIVLRAGEVVAELKRDDASPVQLTQLAYGIESETEAA